MPDGRAAYPQGEGRKRLTVLGSTGSVGEQTLAVAAAAPEHFEVVALAAGRNVEKLAEQVRQFRPAVVSVADASGAAQLRALLGAGEALEVGSGPEGLERVAVHGSDLVVSGRCGRLPDSSQRPAGESWLNPGAPA